MLLLSIKIIFESKPYEEFFESEKENLVYLTADSPNTIDTFDESKIYIIGGIVDKNRYKVSKVLFNNINQTIYILLLLLLLLLLLFINIILL